MPIYEFACGKCRKIYSFLSKRLNPGNAPVCPKCGAKNLVKQMSTFAMPKGATASSAEGGAGDAGMPNMDDPRVMSAMAEMEKEMTYLDETNPRHMAHMIKRMKDILPPGTMPKEIDIAIKRLEAGEDPDKIEEDMGSALGDFMGGDEAGGGGEYTKDSGLYDY